MAKILILASWFPEPQNPHKGIFILRQAQALALNHEVALVYARKTQGKERAGLLQEEFGKLKIYTQVYAGSVSSKNFLKHLALAQNAAEAELGKADRTLVEVLHPAGLLAWKNSLLKRRPYYISEHLDLFLREDMGLDKSTTFGMKIRKLVHARAKRTSISSTALKNSFAKRGIPRLFIIPNVVDIPDKAPSSWSSPEKKRLIHISSLRDHQKNIRGILQGLALLKEKRQDWYFEFLGDGPEREHHEALIQELQLSDFVSFKGYVSEEDKIAALQSSQAHIMLSHYEGFSVATAEAIAYGCPVIVSDCGGPGDFVVPENGYLIEKDPSILAATVDQHLDRYHEFDRQAMYEYIKERYSHQAVLEAYEEFLGLGD